MCILGTTRETQQNKLSSLSAHYNGPLVTTTGNIQTIPYGIQPYIYIFIYTPFLFPPIAASVVTTRARQLCISDFRFELKFYLCIQSIICVFPVLGSSVFISVFEFHFLHCKHLSLPLWRSLHNYFVTFFTLHVHVTCSYAYITVLTSMFSH